MWLENVALGTLYLETVVGNVLYWRISQIAVTDWLGSRSVYTIGNQIKLRSWIRTTKFEGTWFRTTPMSLWQYVSILFHPILKAGAGFLLKNTLYLASSFYLQTWPVFTDERLSYNKMLPPSCFTLRLVFFWGELLAPGVSQQQGEYSINMQSLFIYIFFNL